MKSHGANICAIILKIILRDGDIIAMPILNRGFDMVKHFPSHSCPVRGMRTGYDVEIT